MDDDEPRSRPTILRGPSIPASTAMLLSAYLLGSAMSTRAELAASAAAAFDDGLKAAPGGPPQLPALLAAYAARPPWAVAGIDYAVGVPDSTMLKDPSTISAPGVTVDAARRTVFIDGGGVLLDGYNFGLAGGWGVYIGPGATAALIQNSSFLVGANNLVPIHAARGAGDLTVRRCTFDGGRRSDGTAWALIAYSGSGTFIAEYNVFTDAPADAIDFDSGSMTTVVKYNLFKNLGTSPGSHPDSVQYTGVHASDSIIDFNTIYQPRPSGMQGIQLGAQLSSKISRTTIANNTLIAKGPAIDMSYLIAVTQSPDSEIDRAVVADNYLDFRGAYGAFYPPTGKHLDFIANVDMASGRLIEAPEGTSSTDLVGADVSPASGDPSPGATFMVTLAFDRLVFVTGEPAILFKGGGRAVYASGSGSETLIFKYTGGTHGRRARMADATSVALANGAGIADADGNRIDLSAGIAAHALATARSP